MINEQEIRDEFGKRIKQEFSLLHELNRPDLAEKSLNHYMDPQKFEESYQAFKKSYLEFQTMGFVDDISRLGDIVIELNRRGFQALPTN
jgi:hypothetical protein